ncbi:MAG TPA: aminotransferase class IV [Solirubrobacteraceae bacterium]|nr:aminotransferase class IV [Solirubrobacteraceae bacterium]
MRPDPDRGVFETLLLRDLRVHALDAHLERLERSTRELYGLALPGDKRARMVETLIDAARRAPAERRARIEAIPRGDRLDLWLVVGDVPARRPVSLDPVTLPGGLGAHKWCDRRLVERDPGGAVPLLVDEDGTVLEAAWANVWLLDGDELVTPPLDGRLLPGVTRARLLALAPRLNLHPHEAPITLARARAARSVFLTSALRLAVPASFSRHPQDNPAVDRIRYALTAA